MISVRSINALDGLSRRQQLNIISEICHSRCKTCVYDAGLFGSASTAIPIEGCRKSHILPPACSELVLLSAQAQRNAAPSKLSNRNIELRYALHLGVLLHSRRPSLRLLLPPKQRISHSYLLVHPPNNTYQHLNRKPYRNNNSNQNCRSNPASQIRGSERHPSQRLCQECQLDQPPHTTLLLAMHPYRSKASRQPNPPPKVLCRRRVGPILPGALRRNNGSRR